MRDLYNVVEGILDIGGTVDDITNKAELSAAIEKFVDGFKRSIDDNLRKRCLTHWRKNMGAYIRGQMYTD